MTKLNNPGKFIFSLSLFLVSLGWSLFAHAATVSGDLKKISGSLAGVEVLAYPQNHPTLTGPTSYKGEVDKTGHFKLELPPANYFLLVRGADVFGFYGRNPVSVPDAGIAGIVIPLVRSAQQPTPYTGDETDGVIGRLIYQGQPVAGAFVNVYYSTASGFRGMGLGLAGPSDEKGEFGLQLPAGRYFLLARKRASGALNGPLAPGDFYGYFAGNPLLVASGKIQTLTLEMVAVPEKARTVEMQPDGAVHLRGTVIGADGKGVPGVQVLLYDTPDGIQQALTVSRKTSADGKFALSTPKGGTYFLVARDVIGGPPTKGQMYGQYAGDGGIGIKLERGEILEQLVIRVKRLE